MNVQTKSNDSSRGRIGFTPAVEEKKPHELRGKKRSAYTVYRKYRHSNIHREPGYAKRSRTNKSYAKQAKGFRPWLRTPAQLARMIANTAAQR